MTRVSHFIATLKALWVVNVQRRFITSKTQVNYSNSSVSFNNFHIQYNLGNFPFLVHFQTSLQLSFLKSHEMLASIDKRLQKNLF